MQWHWWVSHSSVWECLYGFSGVYRAIVPLPWCWMHSSHWRCSDSKKSYSRLLEVTCCHSCVCAHQQWDVCIYCTRLLWYCSFMYLDDCILWYCWLYTIHTVTGGGYGVLGCYAQWLANPRHNTTKNTSCGARCKEGPALTVEYIGCLKWTSWAGALRGWFQYYPGWHEHTGGHAVIAQSLPPGGNYMSPHCRLWPWFLPT